MNDTDHPQEQWRRKILSFPESLICSDEDEPDFYTNIEGDGYPRVFGCIVPDDGPEFTDAIMAEWRVALSHPWGG